ncbi:TPA: hypothetical protein ACFIRU_002248, partial [Neisseria gonorrhoeae]
FCVDGQHIICAGMTAVGLFFPIDSCRVWVPDSRFRGNGEEWQDWRGIGFAGLAARPVSVGLLGSVG